MEMEYEFYTEQTYTARGVVEARVLTAAQAAELHYEDGLVFMSPKGKVYIDGFDSETSARGRLAELYRCEVLN
ncbi:MAG: hypothetical protein NC489_19080 [Ruminococcus flavefaciens]|nr:hypothetical protein [Ruminococcus flavefaciens]